MDPEFSEIISKSVLALGISVVIFLITLVLVAKRLIGFFITLLLLFFAIAAGYAILNHDIVREWLKEQTTEKPTEKETKINHYQRRMAEGLEDVREELEMQKERLQGYLIETEHPPEHNYPVKDQIPPKQ